MQESLKTLLFMNRFYNRMKTYQALELLDKLPEFCLLARIANIHEFPRRFRRAPLH